MFPPFPEYHEAGLIVVAARPAMGKTKFLCSLANDRANRHHVLIHSLEFAENQLRNKYCEVAEPSLAIDDTPSLTFRVLESRVRTMVAAHNIKTVAIDCVNLIKEVGSNTVLRSLKLLAKDLNIEIIAGVAVPRRNDGLTDPTVNIADIKMEGSVAIDQFIPLQSQTQYCL